MGFAGLLFLCALPFAVGLLVLYVVARVALRETEEFRPPQKEVFREFAKWRKQ